MFTAYIIAAPIVALVLVVLNWLISINNTYIEKDGPYECGFTSYQQSRTAISVAFILVAILFLPFDMEISLLLPYVISGYNNGAYGTAILVILFSILTMAFVYEIKLNALEIKRHWTPKISDYITKLYRSNN